MVHGELWTVKELFVTPNEYIYWSIQIVMYPFMTGLVAGAFVLSSLYHVFGIQQLKDMARFALVFSFALLFAAPMPPLTPTTRGARCSRSSTKSRFAPRRPMAWCRAYRRLPLR